MCKHILITDFNHDDLETLELFAEKTYDKDGFGAIIRTHQNEIKTLKSLSLASFYMALGKVLDAHSVKDLVVHHRTSTNGMGIDYTHPFEYKGNHLTHNGVISVPYSYKTKTTNDSEILLHHFIETNYSTEDVSGYFSCFVLNERETIVIADEKAPMHTDGRVYCSHSLGKSFEPFQLVKRVINPDGTHTTTPINVKQSDYGQDKWSLSIGSNSKSGWELTTAYNDWPSGWGDDEYYEKTKAFFDMITDQEDWRLAKIKDENKRAKTIMKMSQDFGIYFTESEALSMAQYF